MDDKRRLRRHNVQSLAFALLGDEASTANLPAITASFSAFDTLSPRDVNSHATPFLWLNVKRCYASLRSGSDSLEGDFARVLYLAFDACFDVLPIGTSISFECSKDGELVFPHLMVRAPATGATTLCRVSTSDLTVSSEAGVFRLSADAPNLPTVNIPGHTARLLAYTSPALFEPAYADNISIDMPKVQQLAKMIAASLDLIASVDDELGRRLEGLVGWYVPIHTDDLRTHNSFSAASLNGVIFLSEAYNDLRLAEAIVHEYHHNELYALMEIEELIGPDRTPRFYSPWRDDPRPLFGLFHAIYVFDGVADFYLRALDASQVRHHANHFDNRRLETCRRIQLALAQVPSDEVTSLGSTILDDIRDRLRHHEEHFGSFDSALPPHLGDHLKHWLTRNPELEASVCPAGKGLSRHGRA